MSNAGPSSGRALKVSLSVGLLALTLLLVAVALGLLSQSSGPDAGSAPAPTTTASAPAPTDTGPVPTSGGSEPSSSSSIRILYALAPQQLTGQISVVMDSRPAGVLTVRLNRPTAVLFAQVTSAGRHTYRLAGITTFRSGTGQVEVAAHGQGVVDAAPGDTVAIRSTRQGQAIVLTLE
jgi:hypothetical protein